MGRRPGVTDTILETEGLTREFSGFVAVDAVDLRVETGNIHALIGPNGAGKTTCFNLLTSFLPPTRGTITFKGRDITGMKPAMVARLGLVRSFQISAVFPHLTALENVRLALQRARGASFDFWRSEKRAEGVRRPRPPVAVRRRAVLVHRNRGRRPVLRPEARAGDRHHPGARTRDDAAGRADRRHGAWRRGPHRRADQAHPPAAPS